MFFLNFTTYEPEVSARRHICGSIWETKDAKQKKCEKMSDDESYSLAIEKTDQDESENGRDTKATWEHEQLAQVRNIKLILFTKDLLHWTVCTITQVWTQIKNNQTFYPTAYRN